MPLLFLLISLRLTVALAQADRRMPGMEWRGGDNFKVFPAHRVKTINSQWKALPKERLVSCLSWNIIKWKLPRIHNLIYIQIAKVKHNKFQCRRKKNLWFHHLYCLFFICTCRRAQYNINTFISYSSPHHLV